MLAGAEAIAARAQLPGKGNIVFLKIFLIFLLQIHSTTLQANNEMK